MHSPLFGSTRTGAGTRHAFITPDGFVPSTWPGAQNVRVFFLITPAMGAGFVQFHAVWDSTGALPLPPREGIERFVYMVEGSVQLSDGTVINQGGFAFLAPGESEILVATAGACITVFEKRYEACEGLDAPARLIGNQDACMASPFLGNQGALLQLLLPDEPSHDMAVNIFTYQPGATLPFVERHIMEHGLLMLEGAGIYRLENDWYPTQAGDVIWMAPYCPQWFVAMGDQPARYLYYKNVNRLPDL